MNYYDVVLGLIPLAGGGIPIALLWMGITMSLAVSAGALVAAGLIGHGMFIRSPVKQPVDPNALSSSEHAHQSKTGEYSTAD